MEYNMITSVLLLNDEQLVLCFNFCVFLMGDLRFFFVHNSQTFRKLFPEYVEKYEEQLSAEQSVEPAAPASILDKNSEPSLKKQCAEKELQNVEIPKELNNLQRRRSLPTWLLLLLVFIFGVVMALPLLQL